MPARKKSKLSSEEFQIPPSRENNQMDTTQELLDDDNPKPDLSETGSTKLDTAAPTQQETPSSIPVVSNRSSWYYGAPWLSKASPVAQVARESISVEQGVSSESSTADISRRRPSQSVSKSVKGSRKSFPLAAEETRIHATSDARSKSPQSKRKFPGDEKVKDKEQLEQSQIVHEAATEVDSESHQPGESDAQRAVDGEPAKSTDSKARPGSWFGWWSRPDGYGSDGEKAVVVNTRVDLHQGHENTTGPISAPAHPEQPNSTASADVAMQDGRPGEASQEIKPKPVPTASGKSWFGLWSTVQNEQEVAQSQPQMEPKSVPEPLPSDLIASDNNAVNGQSSQTAGREDEKLPDSLPKSSGWAFWSRNKPRGDADAKENSAKQIGQLAVANTPSQSHPEAAQFNEGTNEQTNDLPKKAGAKEVESVSKRKSITTNTKQNSFEGTVAQKPTAESKIQTPSDTPEALPASSDGWRTVLNTRPNMTLPSLQETYPMATILGYIERLTHFVAQSLHIPGTSSNLVPRHPYISLHSPRIKKAVAIGVHGFFPTPLVQKFIGQTRGTSIRFANHAASSIEQWCHDCQPDVRDVEIEKVALEGEGYVGDRVSTLWKLLLNWLSHLRQADFILVACHSQGVPVAVMLVAKLIQLGCLASNVRLGICAMAGINLGPFAEYKSRLFGGMALELFDFGNNRSKVSTAYTDAIDVCLRHGVRMTFVGSLDDQLVSLESSLYAPLSHHYVNRAIFIDGRLHTPNFLTHLTVFAVKLRNLGVSDHGLIRELSSAVAGSLVGGDGHSRIYDEPAVYRTAVEFALQTTDVDATRLVSNSPANLPSQEKSGDEANLRRASLSTYPTSVSAASSIRRSSLSNTAFHFHGVAPEIDSYDSTASANSADRNPYVLPWAVRSMLAEDLVKRDASMQEEVKTLVKEFEEWKPTSKVLKDVRWRLEGIRSIS